MTPSDVCSLCTTKYFIIKILEREGKLDPDSDIDLFCLHFVYIKKINEALRYFTDGWNSHAVTTESGMAPTQMFVAGALRSSLPVSPCRDLADLDRISFIVDIHYHTYEA